MTSKKRRQRGSRTHGGGTHKNRRGAGNRGGRGRAGRKKHEQHNYEDVGKSGFKRPEKTDRDVREVSVQKLDEDIALLAADEVAEETEFGYRVDARDVAEDGWEADVVKVLGGGQVHEQLEVTADAFSAGAVELIESEGGDAVVSERGTEDSEE
ncbi:MULTISPECIES: uL15m family ribosomal protein [Halobacterium]|jgi:large subunit ribosomal protein L15|uniref:uL15m family ribosomal protein n=1 Tax=Halobacterium TaxID=2239 RepID=UPI001E3CEBB5|nr:MULTISPECIES: uL15m family ribosomal protein [Halobacterium]MCD2200352.1 50S ribosomal protein L15 [Halobacterium sp. KA-4]MCD2204683.1 50S ribosomal protein L15 [Halobacterium sp. KA-6]UHH24691.1 50S ribosomal protein L15 [Halobacterium noricense]